MGQERLDPSGTLQRDGRLGVSCDADHPSPGLAQSLIQILHQPVAAVLCVRGHRTDPIRDGLPFIADLAALPGREVVVHEHHLRGRARQRREHLLCGQLFVDDDHVVWRVGTSRDFLGLALHEQMVTLRVQNLQLHIEGLRCHGHESGHQLPVLPGAAFGGFSRVKEHDARRPL